MNIFVANIIPRNDWGAKDRTRPLESLKLPATDVLITCSETEPCNTPSECKQLMQRVQDEHLKNNLPDAGQK